MQPPTVLPILVLAASLAAHPRTQEPGGEPPSLQRVDAFAPAVAQRDGEVRADGARWTATFDPAGVTFTPALGSRARRSYPLRLTTLAIARESALATRHGAAVAQAEPVVRGDRVEYGRAPGVGETWHARRAGLELSYTLVEPLPGSGDLVARLAVATDLVVRSDGAVAGPASEAARGDAALHLDALHDDGTSLGGVRIGAVTGIDATGRRCAGTLRLADGVLELRLPAAFVDTACHPLVVDPLIGSMQSMGSSADDESADVAYDPQSRRWLAVWHRVFSLGRADVLGGMFDAQTFPVGGLLAIRTLQTGVALRPRVAAVHARGRFVVVWCEAVNTLAMTQVLTRCVEPNGTMSNVATVPAWSLAPQERPVLAGNASSTDPAALLVVRLGATIVSRRLIVPSALGAPSVQGAVQQDDGTLSQVGPPQVVRNAAGGRWVVAWIGRKGFVDTTLQTRCVGSNGSPLGSVLDVVANATSVAIDGDGTTFLTAYVSETKDVYCRRLRWNGSALALLGGATGVTNDTDVEHELALARVGPKYLITWSDGGGDPFASRIQGIGVDPVTCAGCEALFTIARPGRYDYESAVAAGGPAGDRALIVFASVAKVPPFAGEVVVQRYDAIGQGGSLVAQGGGCNANLFAAANGPIAIGNRELELLVHGVLGANSAWLSIGLPQLGTLACGPCTVTPPVVLLPAKLAGDRANVPFGLRCDVGLLGSLIELQWWVFAATPSPCPLVRGLSFSHRYHLTVGS